MIQDLEIKVLSREKVNNKGISSFTYLDKGFILSSNILPYSDNTARTSYGIEVRTTHRIFTENKISHNDFLEYEGKRYVVNSVVEYPNYFIGILELIS